MTYENTRFHPSSNRGTAALLVVLVICFSIFAETHAMEQHTEVDTTEFTLLSSAHKLMAHSEADESSSNPI